jgi:hypothetical protein
MIDRLIGVLTLKAPVYKEIAEDTQGTTQAGLIFVVCTLINGFFSRLVVAGEFDFGRALLGSVWGVLIGLVGWVVTSWVLSFVANALEGKTDLPEMLRVTGYVSVFSLVAVINVLAVVGVLGCVTGLISFAVAILSLVGYIIGIREAAGFDTGKAVITAVIAVVVNFLIVVVIGGLIFGGIAALFLGAAALTGG